MRPLVRASAFALLCTASAGFLSAQAGPGKIVFVNSQTLMEVAPGRAAAESILTKERDGYVAQTNKMQDSINGLLAKYQKEEPTLSATVKDTRQKSLQALETEFQATQLKYQQAFNQHQNEIMAPVTDLVKKVLDDIRTEEGYAMILDNAPGASVIVSADKNLDITDKVVSRLRATPARPMATPSQVAAPKPGAPASPAGVQTSRPPRPPLQ
ncbi:MAG TPA: OmpH family outer membrane protein, partial [Gemmatimonadaceae bacterium]|jgi:outer membrane protein|nr:OmpH family outer membrane protein [Gemmatimonadaceae bacterium]